jgi:RNA polymerase sigma-70 factor (ECF subfamily)
MTEASTTMLQGLLDRFRAGDAGAGDELLSRACERLRRLTRKMLHQDYRRIKRFEDTDDVLQSAIARLLRALHATSPNSVQDYFQLAAAQIRRELIDLARHYYGPEGSGANRIPQLAAPGTEATSQPQLEPADLTDQPSGLAAWAEFHEQVEALPKEERAVFDLLWYDGMSKAEAASVLKVSLSTVKRWWLSARLRLRATLKGEPPHW